MFHVLGYDAIFCFSLDLEERILKQQQEEEQRKRERRERKKEKKVSTIITSRFWQQFLS